MSVDRNVGVLRQVLAAFKGESVDVRGCELWTFGDDGRIVRKNSFWKIREA